MRDQQKTKIICTIGPASDDSDTIRKLYENGMNIARLNFSHGTHQGHKKIFDLIRSETPEVAILIDLPGPKIRVGEMKPNVILKAGQKFTLTTNPCVGDEKKAYINYPDLPKDVKIGNHIAINDGYINLKVISKTDTEVITEVISGGLLKSKKGVNAPDVNLSLYFPTEEDLKHASFALDLEPDFLAASFVRRAQDLEPLKDLIKEKYSQCRIISKIEHRDGVKNYNEILQASDAVMVARGDLGIEIPTEKIPLLQKDLIMKANAAAKPIIVATQMLESMTTSPRPTRAEASDVFNSVLDGADAVMLSGETASGKYPVLAVEFMKKITKEAENYLISHKIFPKKYKEETTTRLDAIGNSVTLLASRMNADAIVTVTRSGGTPRLISKYRPKQPIITGTPYPWTKRQLNLVWGVIPITIDVATNTDDLITNVIEKASEYGLIESDQTIILVAGSLLGLPSNTNLIQVFNVGELLEIIRAQKKLKIDRTGT